MNHEEKNLKIKQKGKETRERHAQMTCKVFSCKVQDNKLSSKTREKLKMMFVEAKWLRNHIIEWSKTEKVSKYNTNNKSITHKDKDMNDVDVELDNLASQLRQGVKEQVVQDIAKLSASKKKGNKVGALKFTKEVNSINLQQFNSTHKILSPRKVKIQGIKKPLWVNGLDQFMEIPGLEVANAKLVKNPLGIYIKFTTFSPKEELEHNGKVIGIDFGCSTAFTTSEGELIEASIQESERLKRLTTRNNNRLVKAFVRKYGHKPDFQNKTDAHDFKNMERSESWKRENQNIKREYQRLSNQKNDLANKIVARLKEYDTIVIQDEMLKAWQVGGHGKAVQHSVLGRVKKRLEESPNTVVLSKNVPTTKTCTKCGKKHPEMKNLNRRIFKCECGVEEDRDVHAAKNMVWFFKNDIGVGRINFKREILQSQIDEAIAKSKKI